jgi:hypothetical protein
LNVEGVSRVQISFSPPSSPSPFAIQRQMIEIRAYGAAFAQLVAAENAPVLLIPAICGSLYPRATARRLSPIIEYVVTRAIVRRLIGTLHHDADSVGAKSTHGQLPMGLLAREVDARAQLMRSGAQRGLLKVTGESALRRSSCVWTNSSLCCGDSVYFT